MLRGIAAVLLAITAGLAVPTPCSAGGGEEILAPYKTKRALYHFLHDRAPTCAPIDAEHEVCSWRLSDDRENWELLATAIGARERFALLCILDQSNDDREPGSCRARVAGKGKLVSADASKAALERAHTFLELVELVGTSPDKCESVGDGMRECVWRVTSYSPGYEVIAGHLKTRKKMRLTCRLPNENTVARRGREPGSCQAKVGAR